MVSRMILLSVFLFPNLWNTHPVLVMKKEHMNHKTWRHLTLYLTRRMRRRERRMPRRLVTWPAHCRRGSRMRRRRGRSWTVIRILKFLYWEGALIDEKKRRIQSVTELRKQLLCNEYWTMSPGSYQSEFASERVEERMSSSEFIIMLLSACLETQMLLPLGNVLPNITLWASVLCVHLSTLSSLNSHFCKTGFV